MPEKFYGHNFPKPSESEDVILKKCMSPQKRREIIGSVINNTKLISDPETRENFLQSMSVVEHDDFLKRLGRDENIKSLPEKTKEDILAQRQTVPMPDTDQPRSALIKKESLVEIDPLRHEIAEKGEAAVKDKLVAEMLQAVGRQVESALAGKWNIAFPQKDFAEFQTARSAEFARRLKGGEEDLVRVMNEFEAYVNEQLYLTGKSDIQKHMDKMWNFIELQHE